jgi:hypothetical protein
MKKLSILFLLLCFALVGYAYAADSDQAASATTAAPAEVTTEAAPAPVAPAVVAPAAPAPAAPAPLPVESAPAAVAPAAPAPVPAANAADNLEFVSGEISALDEANKSITVKLYGEAEANASNKTLTVSVDTTTDITDGEKDRDLKSLTPGTEVDVEYDPATKKATYIFVY